MPLGSGGAQPGLTGPDRAHTGPTGSDRTIPGTTECVGHDPRACRSLSFMCAAEHHDQRAMYLWPRMPRSASPRIRDRGTTARGFPSFSLHSPSSSTFFVRRAVPSGLCKRGPLRGPALCVCLTCAQNQGDGVTRSGICPGCLALPRGGRRNVKWAVSPIRFARPVTARSSGVASGVSACSLRGGMPQKGHGYVRPAAFACPGAARELY